MTTEMSDRIKAKLGMAKAFMKNALGGSDEALLGVLHEQRDAILAAMRKQSDAQSAFRPADDEWSTIEVGRHMIHAHTNVSARIQLMTEGKSPEEKSPKGGPKLGVVPEGPETFKAVCDELAGSFVLLENAFEAICREGADLDTTANHPWFGDMNARGWFAFCALHTLAHIDQIERIASTEGFPSA